MRIAFLTGSVEPGRDGVGDYTSLLAAECSRQGHASCVISLNDTYIDGVQQEERDTVPTLRLGGNVPWPERIRVARTFLEKNQPTCFSFQYVCYAYHPKGLAFEVTKWIRSLVGSTPLHMMFHEVWIGAEKGASLKHRVVGSAQRFFVTRMLRTLKPSVIQTSNVAYKSLLAQAGVSASVLPLFGLIPIATQTDATWLYEEMALQGLRITHENRGGHWLFGQFGTLHPVWPAEPLFSLLSEAAQLHGRKIGMISLGKIGSGEALWESLRDRYSDRFAFCRLGQRSPQQVSEVLQEIDFGFATTPWAIIGKSAAVSTMLDHGLPVIVNRNDLHYPRGDAQISCSSLLEKMCKDLPVRLPKLARIAPRSTISDVTRQFCAALLGDHEPAFTSR